MAVPLPSRRSSWKMTKISGEATARPPSTATEGSAAKVLAASRGKRLVSSAVEPLRKRMAFRGEPVDLRVPAFNIIWQRDANSYALRALELCASPPRILNVTGAETIRVQEIAQSFAEQFGRSCQIQGQEGSSALLSDASLCNHLLGPPSVSLPTLKEWVAAWVMAGGEDLKKPTHFEVVDGSY